MICFDFIYQKRLSFPCLSLQKQLTLPCFIFQYFSKNPDEEPIEIVLDYLDPLMLWKVDSMKFDEGG
jgi:hypothetical protein